MPKPKKSTVFLGLIVFVLGFVFFFPLQNLKGVLFQKIFDNTGILIVAEDIHPVFLGWPGVRINNVNVSLPVGPDDVELASKSMTVRARLSLPFIFTPSLFFKELKGGGNLFMKFGQSGPVTVVALETDAFNLGQIKLPVLGQSINGILNGDISLKTNSANFAETKGTVRLTGAGIKTPAILVNNTMLGPPFQIPELEAGDLDIKMGFSDGVMTISNFKLGNQKTDLSGTLSGEAKLGATSDQTQINLTLRLVFSSKILDNPEYKTFLDFLGAYRTATAGEYAMNWNTTIAALLNNPLPSPLR